MLIVRTTGGETVRWDRLLVGYIDARGKFRTAHPAFDKLDGRPWTYKLSARITSVMKAADAKAAKPAPETRKEDAA